MLITYKIIITYRAVVTTHNYKNVETQNKTQNTFEKERNIGNKQ